MARISQNTDVVARVLASRIQQAGAQQTNETRLVKTASDSSRQARVRIELARIDEELKEYGDDRAEIEEKLGATFNVPGKFGKIVKEASIQALGQLSTYWHSFFAAAGIK